MFVTAPVSQVEMSWLKTVAPLNTGKKEGGEREETVFKRIDYNLLYCMSVTAPVCQLERSPLKALAPLNTGKRW